MALETALQKLKDKRAAYDAALAEITRDKIAEQLAPFIPDGHVLTFTTYVPGFNDGDPCSFTMGEVYLAPLIAPEDGEEESASSYESIDGEDGVFSLDYGDPSTEELHERGLTKRAYANLKRAWKLVPEEVIEKSFGADVVVAIKFDGSVITADYCGH